MRTLSRNVLRKVFRLVADMNLHELEKNRNPYAGLKAPQDPDGRKEREPGVLWKTPDVTDEGSDSRIDWPPRRLNIIIS